MDFYLPLFIGLLDYGNARTNESTYMHIEERTHLLATLLALYPFTDTKELADEFKMTEKSVTQIANSNHIYKSSEKRSRINTENGREMFLRLLHGKRKEKIKGKFNKNKKHGTNGNFTEETW